jgi:hypothetical protein
MNEKGLIDAVIGAVMSALEARLARRGDMVQTDASLLNLLREARDPEASKAFDRPASPPQLPVEPEYPRLRVRYDRETGRALEYTVIEDIRSEIPYMRGWYRRPMSEVEQIRREIECNV